MAQVNVIGRITADLELKTSEKSNPYVRFDIAENIGSRQTLHTQYFQVCAWGEDANRLMKAHAKKGSLIWVTGSLELEPYTKRDGISIDTEQFATHRKTSYYAPGYYSMREMMSDYKDYLCMCELLEHDMKSSFVLFPNDLKAEHDRVNDMSRNDVSQAYDRRIAKMFEGLQHRYGYTQMGFVVLPPHSAKEITQEGDKLHHCVGRYVKDVVKNNTTILFIRKASAPKKPYCTVEVKHGDVIQARIQNNVVPPPKVKRFIESWKENVLYAPALERAA